MVGTYWFVSVSSKKMSTYDPELTYISNKLPSLCLTRPLIFYRLRRFTFSVSLRVGFTTNKLQMNEES